MSFSSGNTFNSQYEGGLSAEQCELSLSKMDFTDNIFLTMTLVRTVKKWVASTGTDFYKHGM